MILLLLSCNKTKEEEVVKMKLIDKVPLVTIENKKIITLDTLKLNINFKAKGSYASIKNKISLDKDYFKTAIRLNKQKTIDSASNYLYHKLVNSIIPHWYETPWDFNGHTNTPNTGEIACGYFVSTTLKHLDFKLNRYKMAQQAGLNIAKALQEKSKLKVYSNKSFKTLKSLLNEAYSDGIYFVGLDNHVGYVLIKEQEIYFLHSSYCDNKVVIELAEKSPCFRSNLYVFAEITTNNTLIEQWILDDTIEIPTS